MKKLVTAFAIVCAAAFAQAASVSWASGKLYTAADANGGFSTTAIKAAATAYLFTLTETQYNDFLADYTANGNMKSVYDAYKASFGSATATGNTKSLTSASSLATEADVGATVYGAIIYTYHDATLDKDFYIANIATGTVGSDAGIAIGNLGNYFLGDTAGTATGGWQAVPEPTSGLLLLLGMAGLALKRKIA